MRLAVLMTTAAALVAATLPAAAQDRSFEFSLRGGVAGGPAYPGSDEYEARPDLGFAFGSLNWGRINIGQGIYGIPENGVSVRGAFRYIGERDSSDYSELSGLDDVDAALELGLGLNYTQTNWNIFGEVRKGVGGHTGWTGTLGSDLIFRPDPRWTIVAGPRINFGDSDYADTYFGVDSATANFPAYDADGGALGAGFEIESTYRLGERWALEGAVSYEKLMNDAADSPITSNGSDDQWNIRFGLSRAFTLRF